MSEGESYEKCCSITPNCLFMVYSCLIVIDLYVNLDFVLFYVNFPQSIIMNLRYRSVFTCLGLTTLVYYIS
jgi:hypothetical protein